MRYNMKFEPYNFFWPNLDRELWGCNRSCPSSAHHPKYQSTSTFYYNFFWCGMMRESTVMWHYTLGKTENLASHVSNKGATAVESGNFFSWRPAIHRSLLDLTWIWIASACNPPRIWWPFDQKKKRKKK